VLGQDVPQHIFRGGALAGGQDGPARQVGHRLDGVALFHHIQHAQGVDRHHLDGPLGLLIEGGGQVGGDGRHIQLALSQQGDDLVRRAVKLQVVAEVGGAVLLHGQQVDQAHGGGALKASDAHRVGGGEGVLLRFGRGRTGRSRFGRGSRFGRIRRRGSRPAGDRPAAGRQAQQQGGGQQQGSKFFHDRKSPSL